MSVRREVKLRLYSSRHPEISFLNVSMTTKSGKIGSTSSMERRGRSLRMLADSEIANDRSLMTCLTTLNHICLQADSIFSFANPTGTFSAQEESQTYLQFSWQEKRHTQVPDRQPLHTFPDADKPRHRQPGVT
mmetsp:Transcript_18111/g.55131  ORF Transcript_18111/g.55131 Transcript_18111/m.55131 type:complete len:133 (+) Transcript_18111:556-954(+)